MKRQKYVRALSLSLLLLLCLTITSGCREETVSENGKLLRKITVTASYGTSVTELSYNSESLLSVEVFKNSAGEKTAVINYGYDENGNKNYRKYETTDKRYIIEESWENNAEGDPKTVSQTVTKDDSTTKSETKYVYDTQNRLTEKEKRSENGKLEEKAEYTYSENNSYEKIITAEGKKTKTKVTLDENGNTVNQKEYNESGELITDDIFTYDEKGNLLTSKSISEVTSERKYEYSNDLLIKTTVCIQSEITQTTEYTYDDSGNTLTEITKDANGELINKIENEWK